MTWTASSHPGVPPAGRAHHSILWRRASGAAFGTRSTGDGAWPISQHPSGARESSPRRDCHEVPPGKTFNVSSPTARGPWDPRAGSDGSCACGPKRPWALHTSHRRATKGAIGSAQAWASWRRIDVTTAPHGDSLRLFRRADYFTPSLLGYFMLPRAHWRASSPRAGIMAHKRDTSPQDDQARHC